MAGGRRRRRRNAREGGELRVAGVEFGAVERAGRGVDREGDGGFGGGVSSGAHRRRWLRWLSCYRAWFGGKGEGPAVVVVMVVVVVGRCESRDRDG